ncbi:DUF6374 family protein [Nocardia abscessus]|uniref:DUF6374 family protein n=1 Tax=Nocardia abscessus TaxID=120957 RepID=UPI0024570CF4|nr:DUF6374 family protein [Nocardia abscessus]
MPESSSIAPAERQIREVRRALLDAAAFGKVVSAEHLEHMADKLLSALQDPRLAAAPQKPEEQ